MKIFKRLTARELKTGVFACFCAVALAISAPQAQADPAPRGYDLILSPQPHAFRYTRAGEPVRRGRRAERFELRDGDCGGSDCTAPRYRSEIGRSRGSIKARVGQDIWYGWSFHNGTLGPTLQKVSLGTVLAQWRLAGNLPAVFRILQIGVDEGNWSSCQTHICNRTGPSSDDIVVQLADMASAFNWDARQNHGHICRLFGTGTARAGWIDIVVNTNFAADASGYLRIWVNGALRCNYSGRLVVRLPDSGTARPRARRGLFVSNTRRWDAVQPGVAKPRMVVFFDEFSSGRRREDVDTRWRQANGKRPVD